MVDEVHDDEVDDAEDYDDARRRWPWVVVGVVVLLAATIAVMVVLDGGFAGLGEPEGDPRSAVEGPEGLRSFEGLPLEMPLSVVPDGATNIEGTAARVGGDWTAAADFRVAGEHEQLARGGDAPLLEDGFVLRQRAFDDSSMLVIYDHDDGRELRVFYTQVSNDEVAVNAVLTGP